MDVNSQQVPPPTRGIDRSPLASSSRVVSPPALDDGDQQAQLRTVVQALPEEAGIDLANWNWKVTRRFVQERFGLLLSRSSCLNYLHRLGFVLETAQETFPESR